MSSRRKNKQARREARVSRPAAPPLLLRCLGGPNGCGGAIGLPAELEVGQAAALLFQSKGWLVSVVSPAGERPHTVDGYALAPLCPPCAEQVHPPEVIAAARKSLGQADTWVAPATSYGELEVRRKAGAEIVEHIEDIVEILVTRATQQSGLPALIEGLLIALCVVRPSPGYAEFTSQLQPLPASASAADRCRHATRECVAWLDANEAANWKRISS